MTSQDYYSNIKLKINLVKLWTSRELCSMQNNRDISEKPYRHKFLYNVNYFDNFAESIKLYDRNIFYTTAKFRFIPLKYLGKDFENKNVVMSNDVFNMILKENIMSYDLFLDFDIDIIKESDNDKFKVSFSVFLGDYINYRREVMTFAKFLYDNNIKFLFNISSMRCINDIDFPKYHITIPYEVIKLPFEFENDVLIYYKELLQRIKTKFNLKYVCLALNGVYNRVQKSPLSLYDNKYILYILKYDENLKEFIKSDNELFIHNENKTYEDFKIFYRKYLK